MARNMAILGICVASFSLSCVPAGSGNSAVFSTSPVSRYLELIEARECYKAYLLLPEVMKELESTPEDAAGEAYSRLFDVTAREGQHDWAKIFQSNRISLEDKIELVKQIDGWARSR